MHPECRLAAFSQIFMCQQFLKLSVFKSPIFKVEFPIPYIALRWPQHNFYVNCHTHLQLHFSILSVPAIGYKSSLVQKHHKSFSYSKKYVLLRYNVVSRMSFHLYYFRMFPLPKYQIIMHFTIFYHTMNAFITI